MTVGGVGMTVGGGMVKGRVVLQSPKNLGGRRNAGPPLFALPAVMRPAGQCRPAVVAVPPYWVKRIVLPRRRGA